MMDLSSSRGLCIFPPRASSLAQRPFLVLALLSTSLLAGSIIGCGDETEEAQSAEPLAPAVGLLELPISHRAADTAPANAVQIDVSPSEIRVDNTKVVDLSNGALSDAGDVIAPLREAITQSPARSAAALKIHVNTPYGTTARILNTLKQSNINTLGFEVRPVSNPNTSGFMVIDNYTIAASPEDAEFPNGVQRNWDEFVSSWEAVYTACRSAHYVDCSHATSNAASGGLVRITLFSRGNGVRADFDRFGVEDEPTGGGPAQAQMLDGVPAPPPMGGEEVEPPPAMHAGFTWRFDGAIEAESPISLAFRPICGARRCGVVQTGDQGTLSMRILSMLGAAFPAGTDSPHVAFVIPDVE